MAHTVYCPTKLIFSDDAGLDLERELATLDPGPVMVITDAGILPTGILDRLMPALSAGGRPVEVFSDVPGNPGVTTVAAGLAAAQTIRPSALVALGGGSAIDVAKAVSVLLPHPGIGGVSGLRWEDLQAGRAKLSGARAPLIAMPTTAGTGSEVSHVAVIGAGDGFKRGVVHASLFPSAAIVDARLALSLPPKLTGATGMDALVHAIEAFLGRRANPSMDLLAVGAMRAIAGSLPGAVADGADLAARREMAQAAAWAGMAMDQAGLGLCHALCGPLSAHHEVHHGLGNAVLLPAVLAFNAPAVSPGRWAALRDALGLPVDAGPDALAGWAGAFIGGLGLPTRLRDMGLDGATFPAIAAEATRMAMIGNNVRAAGEAECLAVLEAAL
ncbi:MAG: iron-containing alcohol dehydrogenase [Anaerolineae bacterium]|nr:iron-containing alcohol dehydrogenase [Anaerolineae bacterium]